MKVFFWWRTDVFIAECINVLDKLFEKINSYDENKKEVNLKKFLDTKLVRENREIKTQAFSKSTKLPVHWSSKIPVRYKRNAITGELHWAKRIASDFKKELKRIRQKYQNAAFLLKFINETICNFERGDEEMIIPEWLFNERKTFSVRFPYSPANEKFRKVFMRKVENFTNDKVKIIIIWTKQKIQSLFNNKGKVKDHSCVIYRGICSCGADYISEMIRNSEIRWNDHITGKRKNSHCFKQLNNHFEHEFWWFIFSRLFSFDVLRY